MEDEGKDDSESEKDKSGTPLLFHVWHSPQPDRTGRGSVCPPDPPTAQQSLSHTIEKVAPHLPSHRDEEEVAYHRQPSCTAVDGAALHQTPCPVQGGLPVGRAAECFPPLSYTPKEVFLSAAAPLQVSPAWPAHYQEDDDASPHLHHHLPFPPLSTPSVTVRTPAGQHHADQCELHSDTKKKSRKKKRKNRGKKDEVGTDDVIMPGGPGTPTVVMKGWGALEAIMKSSISK